MELQDQNFDLKTQIEFLKLMQDNTRFRLISFLFIFPRLSLSSLSSLLRRSKATIIHHLDKLQKLGVIRISSTPSVGPKDNKILELIPRICEINASAFKKIKTFKNIKDLLKFESAILKDNLQFEIIKTLFDQASLVYTDINETITKSKNNILEDSKSYNLQNLINYNILLLSDKQRKIYEEAYAEFRKKIIESIRQEEDSKIDIVKPHLVLNIMFPYKDMMEEDMERKHFKKFFKALD